MRREHHARGAIVRVIRALDRRGGLSSRRAERAYARSARLFRGLHARVLADTVEVVGARAATIVDIGSGPGDVPVELEARLPEARILGVEPSRAMRELSLGRGIVALEGRAEAIPLDAGAADLIVSTLSSHHWDDPVAAFREIDRVLAAARRGLQRGRGTRHRRSRQPRARGHPPRTVLTERLLRLRVYALVTIAEPPPEGGTP